MGTQQQRRLTLGKRKGWVRIENPPVVAAHRKLFNLLLRYHLQGGGEDDGATAVDMEALRPHLDFSGRFETQLLLACQQLAQTHIRWELADASGGREMGFAALLSQAWCEGRRLHFSVPLRLSALLHHEKAFGIIHLDVLGLFTDPHARALYTVLLPLARVETRGWWEVDEFRRRMDLPAEASYPRFSDLRRRVIEPALEEINALSDLDAAVEYRRSGRRVTGIKFRVTRKSDSAPAECLYLPGADPDRMDRVHALEQEFETYKAARVCEIIAAMSAHEAGEWLAAFVKSIQDNAVLMKKYERDGLDNLSVRLRYEAFLERMLLPAEDTDFRRFLERRQGAGPAPVDPQGRRG